MNIISRLKHLLPFNWFSDKDKLMRPKLISHIVAMSCNRVIGVDNDLPWRLPNDLKFFKRNTLNKTILMGRKTFDSIGKPLPKRRNIVLTRQADLVIDGCEVVSSIRQAYELCKDDDELMIIGGANLYEQTLDDVQRIYLTKVDCTLEGDAFYAELEQDKWNSVVLESHAKDEKHAFDYEFLQLDRKN